eukprot:608670-Ditylum_brightwellii.AAC.1
MFVLRTSNRSVHAKQQQRNMLSLQRNQDDTGDDFLQAQHMEWPQPWHHSTSWSNAGSLSLCDLIEKKVG